MARQLAQTNAVILDELDYLPFPASKPGGYPNPRAHPHLAVAF
jgi:hypothetical protein